MMTEQEIRKYYKKINRRDWIVSIALTAIWVAFGVMAGILYGLNISLNGFAVSLSFAVILSVIVGVATPVFVMENHIEMTKRIERVKISHSEEETGKEDSL